VCVCVCVCVCVREREREREREYVCTHTHTHMVAGDHVLTWVFHKEREYSWMSDSVDVSKPNEDRAVIESIKVSGVAIGGSTGSDLIIMMI